MKVKLSLLCLVSCVLMACSDMHADSNKKAADDGKNYSIAVDRGSIQNTKYVPVPIPGQLMSVKGGKAPRHLVGEAAINAANKKAMKQPNSGEYINSIMTFDYMAGALYQIYCAPLSVTDLQFQNNEHIVAVAAGDTLRWQVSKTYSGAGATRHEHLLIKPIEDGLTNSLVVTSDLRTYHLMLHSTPKTYMASVTWRYPDSDGVITSVGEEQELSDADITSGVDVNRLNFNYEIKMLKGKNQPDWFPRMVFNDGNKTYIKFPSQMQEAPTLFVGSDAKHEQLINYRVVGNYYVVDRLLTSAQLRGGQQDIELKGGKPKDLMIVQINYKGN